MKHEITEEETRLAEQIREKAKELQALAQQLVSIGWSVEMDIPSKGNIPIDLGLTETKSIKIHIKQTKSWAI